MIWVVRASSAARSLRPIRAPQAPWQPAYAGSAAYRGRSPEPCNSARDVRDAFGSLPTARGSVRRSRRSSFWPSGQPGADESSGDDRCVVALAKDPPPQWRGPAGVRSREMIRMASCCRVIAAGRPSTRGHRTVRLDHQLLAVSGRHRPPDTSRLAAAELAHIERVQRASAQRTWLVGWQPDAPVGTAALRGLTAAAAVGGR